MSLIPAFKIGLWNAWIIIVLSFLTSIISSLINKEASARGKGKWEDRTKTEKIVVLITHALVGLALVIYSIFLPLKTGTVWFYVGIPICFLSLVMNLMAGVAFATTPLDEPVTRGGLLHFKTSCLFGRVFAVCKHRYSLCFLDFSAMCSGMDNIVEYWSN